MRKVKLFFVFIFFVVLLLISYYSFSYYYIDSYVKKHLVSKVLDESLFKKLNLEMLKNDINIYSVFFYTNEKVKREKNRYLLLHKLFKEYYTTQNNYKKFLEFKRDKDKYNDFLKVIKKEEFLYLNKKKWEDFFTIKGYSIIYTDRNLDTNSIFRKKFQKDYNIIIFVEYRINPLTFKLDFKLNGFYIYGYYFGFLPLFEKGTFVNKVVFDLQELRKQVKKYKVLYKLLSIFKQYRGHSYLDKLKYYKSYYILNICCPSVLAKNIRSLSLINKKFFIGECRSEFNNVLLDKYIKNKGQIIFFNFNDYPLFYLVDIFGYEGDYLPNKFIDRLKNKKKVLYIPIGQKLTEKEKMIFNETIRLYSSKKLNAIAIDVSKKIKNEDNNTKTKVNTSLTELEEEESGQIEAFLFNNSKVFLNYLEKNIWDVCKDSFFKLYDYYKKDVFNIDRPILIYKNYSL